MNNFYITLPSNVDVKEYPNNKTSHFFTPLPKEINLTGEWEVALVEISFPQSWYNVEQNVNKIIYGTISIQNRHTKTIYIPTGYYKNAEDLIKTINKNISSNKIKIQYNTFNEKTYLTLSQNYRITFHQNLARMLGFYNYDFAYKINTEESVSSSEINEPLRERRSIIPFSTAEIGLPDKNLIAMNPDDVIHFTEDEDDFIINESKNTKTYICKYIVDLCAGLYSIYVYINIVKNSIVGNMQVPLLRIVDKDNENFLQYVTKQFIDPQYIPLKYNNFKEIEISLRDDIGNLIKFRFGKVILILHFRKKKFI